jgi:hypothetical protein
MVLVNDILKRRVLLLDSSLTQVTVVADSTSSTANAYGARAGGLLSYRGDSALFVDPASMSMLVVNSEGKITRVMSAPRPSDVVFLVGGPNGTPGFDARGRLVYRAQPPMRMGGPARGSSNGSTTFTTDFPDTVPVVRFDLASRSLDTAGFFKVYRPQMSVTQTANGGIMMSSKQNPIPTVDDWALLSDGTIAFVKGTDYSITWVDPDGSKRTTGKVPYEWQRLDEDGKTALLDSARKAMEEARERAQAQMAAGGGPVMIGGAGPEVTTRVMIGGGGAPPARGAGDGRGGDARGGPGGGPRFELPPINLVNADELPDYRPAFTAGSARGDLDGNLWVRTTSPVGNEGPIYFVINTKGEVIDRVQLPQGRTIAGFGKGGDIYLALRDAEGNARVERAKIK